MFIIVENTKCYLLHLALIDISFLLDFFFFFYPAVNLSGSCGFIILFEIILLCLHYACNIKSSTAIVIFMLSINTVDLSKISA